MRATNKQHWLQNGIQEIIIYLIRYTSRHWLSIFLYRWALYLNRSKWNVFYFKLFTVAKLGFRCPFCYSRVRILFFSWIFKLKLENMYAVVSLAKMLHSTNRWGVTTTLTMFVRLFVFVSQTALSKFAPRFTINAKQNKTNQRKKNVPNRSSLCWLLTVCEKLFIFFVQLHFVRYVYQMHRLSIWRSITQSHSAKK